VRILIVTNLYPPHHAGTFDFRCQNVTEALRRRGHTIRVLTSNHGIRTEERDPETERRLWLNGVYGHPSVTKLSELRALEAHNHQVFRETLGEFQPELLYVWSLHGLSKSLLFAFRHARLPVVYDLGDDWLGRELREDPWLRWWNGTAAPFAHRLQRTTLEWLGQRSRFDRAAPTRLMRAFSRLPEVYGDAAALSQVQPNSISAFPFDRIYFCSQSLKDAAEMAGFRVAQGEVIRPGIATERYVGDLKPMATPMTRFLIVTDVTPESGVKTAVEAVKKARESKVQLKLTIFGRGESDLMAQLRSLVVTHALPVEFSTMSNLVRDLPSVYRAHDVFLYTAEWDEPYALEPLEAMASGLPIIAARSGGLKELLRHGENAFTYAPGNAAELAARIQELQRQPALRCQMAETAQTEVLSKYNETVVVDQIESFLDASMQLWQQS
jgi:glycosyltransferase involved in cell wall biosynthesis